MSVIFFPYIKICNNFPPFSHTFPEKFKTFTVYEEVGNGIFTLTGGTGIIQFYFIIVFEWSISL